jgi:ketosteroid isomerase-like protein
MKKTILLKAILLSGMLLSCSQAQSNAADTTGKKNPVEELIWNQEEEYFTSLYRADYDGVLDLVHDQFLGWPGGLPQPVGRKESAGFMKQLIPRPTSCTIWIERAGIRVLGTVALTQYTLHVSCSDTAGAPKIPPSRITHTWVKEGEGWKLLGGMSFDK